MRILRVRDLTVRFNGEPVLQDVSFEVEEGQTVTILGPNGAGKTVLLRALLGLVPYTGEIEWERKVRIGYVPQRVPLFRDFPITVQEFLRLKKVPCEGEVFRSLAVQDILRKPLGVLSSGQFQRVLLVFALLGDPDVLLFDEPMSGLDVGVEKTVYHYLKHLQKKRNLTLIMVTHDLSVVHGMSDRCICLNKRVLCAGPPSRITARLLSRLYGRGVKIYEHKH